MERLSASRLSREALIAQCDRQAQAVLERLGITRPRVPENVVSYSGDVAIERMDWKELVGAVHGVRGRWVIGLNRNDSLARQRFTLMHEFKHALDGLRTVRDYRQYRQGMPKPLEEYLADHFATQLLMPKTWVIAAWQRMPHLGRLAWRFGVSQEAMRLRLTELGLSVDERPHGEWATPMPRVSKRHRQHLPAPRDGGTKRYFVYARVSSQDQADRDLSIPAQLKAVHEYAERRGLTVVEEFIDIESAKEPGRKRFSEMMARLHKDARIAGAISHKVDRLLRNFKDYVLVDDLMKAGVDFQFVHGNYDNSPVGMLGLGVQVLFAKHYLDNLSQEVKKGMNQRMLEKRKWAFVAPLGYINKDREILPDPERFPLLREGWHRYATGAYSLKALADWLYEQGLRTRGTRRDPPGLKVRSGPLYAVFNNPFYYGMMRYKAQLIPGTHEPMITKATFDRVQGILHHHGNPRPQTPKVFTYRGFLVCGECGRSITAEEQKGHVYYRCTKSGGPTERCSQRYVREETLEEQLVEQLRALEIPDSAMGLVRRALRELHAHEQEFRDAAVAALRRRQDDIQKRQDVLLNRLLDGTVGEEVYREKYTALQNEKAEILVELEAHERANERWFEETEMLVRFANQLGQTFAKSAPGQKIAVLKVLASNATLEGGKARLNLKTAFSPLAKSRPCSNWLRG